MKNFLTIALLGALLFSCGKELSLSPYSNQIQNEAGLSDEDLQRVQFYVSSPIVLYRSLNRSQSEVVGGEIKVINGKEVEQIVIDSGTPGVLIAKPTENKILVSFEEGYDKSLVFGRNGKRGGYYTLLARDWENGTGTIDYAGTEFTVKSAGEQALLLVRFDRNNNTQVRSRQVSGRTVLK
jgi:hypothetical protein